MKYVFVPISIVGCGKSTVFRTLTNLSSRFVHIENDYFTNKRAFNEALTKLIEGEAPYILVDRNNHLRLHRKQLTQTFKKEDVCFIALLFVPSSLNRKQLFDTNWRKIQKRGDNHPQVKSESNDGQAKMILGLFIKNLEPFNPQDESDAKFDHILAMKFGANSSRENVDTIIKFVQILEHGNGLGGHDEFDKSKVDQAFKNSMCFVA